MRKNLILNTDSYKGSHSAFYPSNATAQFAYIEARAKDKVVIPFGLQMFIKQYLLTPITQADIDEASEVFSVHGIPFINRNGWGVILHEYGGLLPLTITAIPEGTPTLSGVPLVIIESTDARLFWLPSYIETALQRGFWYPTTIASNDFLARWTLESFYEIGSDKLPHEVGFALHDFGSRGVSSFETAAIGGVAHLVNFKGTDNLAGIIAARDYYHCEMGGYSIPATEHSIQCAYGEHNQLKYLRNVLFESSAVGIVSIVLDGYDIYKDTELLCQEFAQEIINNDHHVVIRPDSGDPLVVLPVLLDILDSYFGHVINNKGYRVLNNVKLLQGDGIDYKTMCLIAELVAGLNYAPETVVYGSGGGLLQKVNRDDYSFAQKTSAMEINGSWVDTIKSPITDKGKQSKGGRLSTANMVTYYHNGELLVDDSLYEIRKRCNTAV